MKNKINYIGNIGYDIRSGIINDVHYDINLHINKEKCIKINIDVDKNLRRLTMHLNSITGIINNILLLTTL
jgi:hypothetical protein